MMNGPKRQKAAASLFQEEEANCDQQQAGTR
jgi:hypothetical protein